MSSRDDDILDFAAVQQPDGSWLHNDDAIVWYNEKGGYHREDGPAVRYASGKIDWYLNDDVNYSFDEWCIKLNKSDEEKMLLRLQYG